MNPAKTDTALKHVGISVGIADLTAIRHVCLIFRGTFNFILNMFNNLPSGKI